MLEISYRALKVNTTVIVDTITCMDFTSLHWELAIKIIDQIPNTNRRWHTCETDRGVGTYTIGA